MVRPGLNGPRPLRNLQRSCGGHLGFPGKQLRISLLSLRLQLAEWRGVTLAPACGSPGMSHASATFTCRLTLFPMEHHSLETPLPSCPLPLPGLFLQPRQATCPLYQLHQIVWSPTHLHFLVPPHAAWVAPGARLFGRSEPQLPSCEREGAKPTSQAYSSMRRLCC